MLSVLIPTRNYNVTTLVKELHKQLTKCFVNFEIIVHDDGSGDTINNINNQLNNLKHVTYTSHKNNLGLSENRNTLVNASQYNHLLFIDGDSLIHEENYIQKYLEQLKNNPDVVYGGRIHPKKVSEHTKKLRWKYGLLKEDTKAQDRILTPYKSLLFNNTLIRKSIFKKVGFEKSLTQYGHEDTLLSYQLKLLNTNITHIDNPVLHGDIDESDVFIDKTKNGIENLNQLYEKKLIDYNYVTLLKAHKKVKKLKIDYFLAFIFQLNHPFLKIQLRSKRPSLFVFNLFKLSYLCHINLNR
ncbi:glycosyltransferase family 2 protein [Mangrovimonas aestuarii]|uniref:glycosyltransferase family 2 protein n=1 Tax=Mangrovimonas aestuarii TaxID=3018443 RepID=UPI0023783E05|nr:glycosyltransferase family 2 protein [Mangrovimonas aestuarii]